MPTPVLAPPTRLLAGREGCFGGALEEGVQRGRSQPGAASWGTIPTQSQQVQCLGHSGVGSPSHSAPLTASSSGQQWHQLSKTKQNPEIQLG